MQSTTAKLAIVGAALVAAIALFIVLSNDDSDEPSTAPVGSVERDADSGDSKQRGKEIDDATQAAQVPRIEVKDGEPVGGVDELSFTTGDEIRFRVASDAPAEVHFHGYDVMMDVGPGEPVTFEVPADIEGIFEVELEETAVQIAEIQVNPG